MKGTPQNTEIKALTLRKLIRQTCEHRTESASNRGKASMTLLMVTAKENNYED
jgi:hypothetical protein